MAPIPRVAFFTDTYAETNGVALTSRQLESFARRRDYPFLCIKGADRTGQYHNGSVTSLELARGAFKIGLDRGLRHDVFLWRHQARVAAALRAFRPDVIHAVSPGDVSEIGVYLAKRMKLPLALSWHTNLHEFAALRLGKMLGWIPPQLRASAMHFSEAQILKAVLAFYRLGDVLYAPNSELIDMLRERTGKPVFHMKRGIDTQLFTPAKRTIHDGTLRLGYVGRTTPEKSVRFLRELETALIAAGVPPFRLLIVGDGSERAWLGRNLKAADLPGTLRGEDLAQAYANMDVFVFPSRTDTFGNVVLEAFASGVPAIVTNAGGPKFIVREGISGFVSHSETEFVEHTARLLRDEPLRSGMARAARGQACGESWDSVFEKVYEGYSAAIAAQTSAGKSRTLQTFST
jgi:glycosyltransferase involved in cell wall biosynthesis